MSEMHFPRIDCFHDTGKRNADYEQTAALTVERNPHSGASVTKSRCLMLTWTNNIICDHPIFTGLTFEKQGISLEISIIDAANQNHVVKDGPESSAPVEIVVLSKDFNFNEQNRTFEDYFNSRIVDALLRGNSRIYLKNGIASVSQIFFRHKNRHMRIKEFRLGARIIGGFIDAPVREAITEPFTLKDRRIMSKKHYPPRLDDEVWRLENIGKGGPFHQRLREKNINSVKDFLAELTSDPENLRSILKMTKTPQRWEATVNHALTCTLSDTQKVLSERQPEYGSISSNDHLDNFWNNRYYFPHEYE